LHASAAHFYAEICVSRRKEKKRKEKKRKEESSASRIHRIANRLHWPFADLLSKFCRSMTIPKPYLYPSPERPKNNENAPFFCL
jgi:hypothetical protein